MCHIACMGDKVCACVHVYTVHVGITHTKNITTLVIAKEMVHTCVYAPIYK